MLKWLDHEEEDERGRDHEGQEGIDEEPILEFRVVDGEREVGEVLAEDRSHNRGNEGRNHRGDNGGERSTDGNSNRKIHHVAAEDEVPKFLDETFVAFRRLNHVLIQPPWCAGLRAHEELMLRAGGGTRTHDLTITNRLRFQLRHTGRSMNDKDRSSEGPRLERLKANADWWWKRPLADRGCGWQAWTVSTPSDETTVEQPEGGSPLNLNRAILVGLAFIIVLLVASNTMTERPSGTSSSTTVATTSPTTTTTASAPTSTIPRSQIKVQVANGTSTSGVATTVTSQLQSAGWDALPPVNTTTPASASAVYFASGRRTEALEIAKELSVPASAVAPLTTSVPVPGASGDDIVFVIGPDLAKS